MRKTILFFWAFCTMTLNAQPTLQKITLGSNQTIVELYQIRNCQNKITLKFHTTFEGTFTAKINSSGRLVIITYIDASGLRGSKIF